MKKTEVTLELDPCSLDRIQALAKEKGKTINDEAAYLLQRGVDIVDGRELREKGKKSNLTTKAHKVRKEG